MYNKNVVIYAECVFTFTFTAFYGFTSESPMPPFASSVQAHVQQSIVSSQLPPFSPDKYNLLAILSQILSKLKHYISGVSILCYCKTIYLQYVSILSQQFFQLIIVQQFFAVSEFTYSLVFFLFNSVCCQSVQENSRLDSEAKKKTLMDSSSHQYFYLCSCSSSENSGCSFTPHIFLTVGSKSLSRPLRDSICFLYLFEGKESDWSCCRLG